MKWVFALVEGQTEEAFMIEVLNKHLAPLAVYLQPILVETKRTLEGKKHKGGYLTYAKTRKQLLNLLGNSHAALVTTMLDYYAMGEDFPGQQTLPLGTAAERVRHLEDALAADIGQRKFLAYFSLHEFEALLFVAPAHIAMSIGGEDFTLELETIKAAVGSPEEIDESPLTAPSKQIKKFYPQYDKPFHGPLIALEIGLEAIRADCPHFNEWLTKLESLGQTSS